MNSKRWFKSKTLWLNSLACVITIVQALQGQAWFEPELQVLMLAILNALVRFLTKTQIV